MMSELGEILTRLEFDGAFEVQRASRTGEIWELDILPRKENDLNGFEIQQRLNGWNRVDFFGIVSISKVGLMYKVSTERRNEKSA